MKRFRVLLYALLCMILTVCGCGTEGFDEAAISDSIAIVEDLLDEEYADEAGNTEDLTDEASTEDSENDDLDTFEGSDGDVENTEESDSTDISEVSQAEDGQVQDETPDGLTVEEDGTYTSKDEVALYIHIYGKLPDNFITKSEAEALGWVSREGNLDEVAPGMSIGGNRYGNYEQLLPDGNYKECDINYHGGYRGDERLVYSDEGDIYYTDDHYGSFVQLYSGQDE